MLLHFLYPFGGSGYGIEVEHVGIQYLVEVDVAVVTVDNLCLGLQLVDDAPYTAQFFRTYFRSLVQQYDVTELNLLDDEVLNIFFVNVLTHQVESAAKFVSHTESVDNGHDAVETGNAMLCCFWSHRGNGTDGLRNGTWFADTAGLDDNVVEALQSDDVLQLFNQIHLQGTTDATVLKGHKAVVLLINNAALLNEVGIDIHLADVIHNHGKLNALTVVQYSI